MQKIETTILEKLKSIDSINFLSKYSINSFILFGSLNNGEFAEESDVDLAIICEEKMNLENILEIELYFEDILKREIDVIDLKSDSLDLFLKINILNNGKVLYTRDENKVLEEFKNAVDWIYRENKDYIFFRKRDVLG